MTKYRIADLLFELNAPEGVLHESLLPFLYEADSTDISCFIVFEEYPDVPMESKCLLKTKRTAVYIYNDYYQNVNSESEDIPSCIFSNNTWSSCTVYIDPVFFNPIDKQTVDNVRNGILGALRSITIAALSHKQGVLVHSSSIIWNGEGVLFSAPSGEGKSTHTNMWRQKYGTEILDGDVTALRIIDEVPYAYGLPWCGTSGEFLNKRVPLRAIVFLQQAKENKIKKLNFQEAFIRLASRCFMLPYDEQMTSLFLDIAQEIASKTDCYLLECLPNYEAVELVKKCLEKN